MGWTEEVVADTFHVYPVDDLLTHDTDGQECACLPEVEPVERDDGSYGWLVVHNAWDGRI